MPRVEIDGLRIRYRQQGPDHPPILVLIHGAAGGQYVWQEQFDGLRDAHGLLAVDLPGHGSSDAPATPLGIEDQARCVAALTRRLGLSRYVAVGHSMGGAVALTLALTEGPRIAGLVLLATGARLPVSELIFGAIDHAFDSIGELLAQTAYGPDTSDEILQRYARGPLQCDAATARADFEACQAFDLRTRLGGISMPALILGGSADALVGVGRWKQLEAGLPDARLEVMDGAGHMVMQERPAAVNAAIAAFMETLVSPAPE